MGSVGGRVVAEWDNEQGCFVPPGAVPGTPACAALSPQPRVAVPQEKEPEAGPTAASLFRGLLCGFERKQLTSHTFEDWMAVEDWVGLTTCALARSKPNADWSAAMTRGMECGMDDAQSPASSAASSPRYYSAFMDQSFFP